MHSKTEIFAKIVHCILYITNNLLLLSTAKKNNLILKAAHNVIAPMVSCTWYQIVFATQGVCILRGTAFPNSKLHTGQMNKNKYNSFTPLPAVITEHVSLKIQEV